MKLTIKLKFLLGFFTIFLISFIMLNFSLSNILEKNNEKTINNELITLKENSNIYIRQTLMLNKYNNEEIYFEKISNNIVEELRNVTDGEICLYNTKGQYLFSSEKEKFTNAEYDDIKNAIKDKDSYTIEYGNKTVYFSYPVVIAGEKIGILRIMKDYSVLFNRSEYILKVVSYMTILIFAIAFLFSYLLSKNITIPIIKLTNASSEVAKGNLDIKVNINSKDEIGELAANFSKMIEQINSQIKIIEKDRDSLKEINKHRKIFFDNVTHELKTPLTAILGYSEMIKENGFTDKTFFDKGTNHIIDESKRLNDMVLKLLEYSKESSELEQTFEKVDIKKLLEDTCADMTFKAKRYKDIITFQIKEEIFVYGSEYKLKQVFINIIDNAIKYGKPNSEIKVSAYTKDRFAMVDIKNTGIGIETEDIEKIFKPFSKTTNQKSREIGSCGLGLSISKAIIDKHKGYIGIESIVNKETTFTVQLPLYEL